MTFVCVCVCDPTAGSDPGTVPTAWSSEQGGTWEGRRLRWTDQSDCCSGETLSPWDSAGGGWRVEGGVEGGGRDKRWKNVLPQLWATTENTSTPAPDWTRHHHVQVFGPIIFNLAGRQQHQLTTDKPVQNVHNLKLQHVNLSLQTSVNVSVVIQSWPIQRECAVEKLLKLLLSNHQQKLYQATGILHIHGYNQATWKQVLVRPNIRY